MLLILLGCGVLVASVIGASQVLNPGANQEDPALEAPREPTFPVAFGHVDVEGGVISLYPLQPGRVVEVLVKENEFVKKGAVLFRLDDRMAEYRVRAAEADLDAARAQVKQAENALEQHGELLKQQAAAVEAKKSELDKAQALFDKANRLYESKLGSKEDRDAADALVREAREGIKVEEARLNALRSSNPQLTIDRARADVTAKQAQLDQAKYLRDECQLKAPADGTILRLLVSVGDVLGEQPKEPAIIFCPSTPRIIRAEVNQEWAPRVQVGQSALILDDARLKGEWRGKVRTISDWYSHRRSILMEPREFNDIRTLECIVELEPDQPPLRIGQRVRVIFGK